jgi:uncharacterized protein YjcR
MPKRKAPERYDLAGNQATAVGGKPNGRCRMHGGKSPGAPKGNKNALKHGGYSVEEIARRREVAALLRAMRKLVRAQD